MPEPTAGMDGGEAGMPGQEEYVLSKIEKISDSEYRVSLMRKRAEINEKPIEIRLFDAKRDILPKPKTPDGRGAPGGNPAMPMRMPSRG